MTPKQKEAPYDAYKILLNYPQGRDSITPEFVRSSKTSALALAHVLNDSPMGNKLLASKPELIDALLEKDPNTAIIITQALRATPEGKFLLRKNKLIDALIVADESGEVEKILKKFTQISPNKLEEILKSPKTKRIMARVGDASKEEGWTI